MVKFCRLAVSLLLMLTVTTGIARLLGSTQTALLAMLFTNPDATPCQRPCLFGVQPGRTSYNRAVELLRSHPFTRAFQSEGTRNMFSDGSLSVILSLDADDTVSRMTLVSYSDTSPVARWASLGEVVALLGVPNMVERNAGHIQSYYLENRLVFSHQYASGELTFNEPCGEISVYPAATNIAPVVLFREAKAHAITWQKFWNVNNRR